MAKREPMIDREGVLNPSAVQDFKAKSERMAAALKFPAGWVEVNWQVWSDFVRLANLTRLESKRYYSAREVLTILRWRRAMDHGTTPAVTNDLSARLSRLYNALVGRTYFRTKGV